MNIDKLGDKQIDLFVEKNLIRSFSDIYKLSYETLIKLERQGEKSVTNLLASIEKSKNTTLARFIFAIGIRFVGEQTAKNLTQHFGTLEAFLKADESELLEIDDIGPKVAHSILDMLSKKYFVNEILELKNQGLTFSQGKKIKTGQLKAKSFVITGTLPVGRNEAKELIESHGGKVLGSVSKKLDYLVVGNEPGSKFEKAQTLGVKVLNWDDLQNLLAR